MSLFTEVQHAEFVLLVAAKDYPAAYRFAANIAEATELGTYASITWLRQSAMVNEGVGPLSDFIRTYSGNQYYTRYGSAVPEGKIQEASDKIADVVLKQIQFSNEMPNILEIARDDASGAAELLFGGDIGGWAGNPLFLILGVDQPLFSNILETDGDTYDALAMTT